MFNNMLYEENNKCYFWKNYSSVVYVTKILCFLENLFEKDKKDKKYYIYIKMILIN